ncbi:MAG: nucleotidyltransferase domain-containing protein [Candidatus Aminicenantes bacterium]|nr:nucleotidyltransferase domain-containing protein [Candidatus Aminicenantes bacterium]
MDHPQNSIDKLLHDMRERAKELNCLYQVEELLTKTHLPLAEIFTQIIQTIPSGYQFPEICQVKIVFDDKTFLSPAFKESLRAQSADIKVDDKVIGHIEVSYTSEVPKTEGSYFLKEEHKLLNTVAERIGRTILHLKLEQVSREWKTAQKDLSEKNKKEWMVIIDLLRRTDQNLYIHLGRKMVYHLFWNGVMEAKELLKTLSKDQDDSQTEMSDDMNRPSQKKSQLELLELSDMTFKIAARYLTDQEILSRIQKWIQEDKASFLSKAINNIDMPLVDVINAITHYHYISGGNYELSPPMEKGLRVSLIRRFFSDQLEFINIAKNHIEVRHFYDLVQRIIYPANGYGRLGGKSAGLFLAQKIFSKPGEYSEILSDLRFPKTWYITTDAIMSFLSYNNLEEVNEQKYKEIDQIRLEYQNVIQLLKNSHFPIEIIKGLSMALDDLGDKPLIVRSSSLLEDRMGTAFSGKYKSLFLANQGTKQEKLDALTDAIAEVYASIFGPDPIEYRAERGLLDFHEEMGIMIQEVVGQKVGDYFFPAFAGVAFSNNEFRWSSRIKREDGLARIVPGLGTRAVDRVSDDYPILISPGIPNLRVNVTAEETMRYSPRRIDVINLKTCTFETKEIPALLEECGHEYPGIEKIVSVYEDDHIHSPSAFALDFSKHNLFVTFEGLISRTPFIKQLQTILKTLQEKMCTPIDIEFAADGKNLYLLQCRPQSSTAGNVASPIPKDIAEERIVFSANRYISNGKLPDITHIVYVDPEKYSLLEKSEDMLEIGRVVGRLNSLLPKRQFILMGPGRWGSRGDIKLGVPVTYSDFNNTAALIEIARKKGNYVPELSFGTHFFQDLVESSIRYLPLYPDDPGIEFNEKFLLETRNYLPDILPESAALATTVHVIDVPQATGGKVLRVVMNADQGEALGFIATPLTVSDETGDKKELSETASDDHWHWRLRMAERIASQLDGSRFGVKAMYVFGSTKNATSGPGSDIDLLIHFRGSEDQLQQLILWLEGWSLCLAEINYSRTGYKSDGLIDYHILTDDDIAKKSSYAVKIGAITDAARPLTLKAPMLG